MVLRDYIEKLHIGLYKHICNLNVVMIIAVTVTTPSLPLCSREGGTAVPDEIEDTECSMHSVHTDITIGSISSVAAATASLTHKGSLGPSSLMPTI